MEQKSVVVAVSGGFDPVHIGHIRLFRDARALGDKLIVILNDDAWLRRKKGYVFMPQEERRELIESIVWVDEVIMREPRDTFDVAHMLEKLEVDIFANGGVYRTTEQEVPETAMCKKRKITMMFNIGDRAKPQSSSQIVENLVRQVTDATVEPWQSRSS